MTPSEAVENADWIAPRLHHFAAYDVGTVVPTGFAAYARILHPAFIGDVEVRWSEVAEWSGKTIHPEVQFHAIAEPAAGHGLGPERFSHTPRNGVLAEARMRALAGLLSKHTSTGDRCWFCLWEGYGYINRGGVIEVRAYRDSLAGRWARWRHEHLHVEFRKPQHPRISIKRVTPNPQRSYLLFSGPVTKAAGWQDGPNLLWPDDRAWCVASEIDFAYTYIGGSKELIDEILKDPALEALPSDVAHGISYYSDKINSTR
ncbi:MAG: hypothetical protein ACYDA0_10465 [Candidatus Dormibacteraceae bacterium]